MNLFPSVVIHILSNVFINVTMNILQNPEIDSKVHSFTVCQALILNVKLLYIGHVLLGFISWVLWRSAYTTRLGSWRLRMQVPLDWFKTFFFGRDTSRF